jgi:NADP-dependent 3-hydroxy acid dehydrogenase YdfG
MSDSPPLRGATALVTGASRGIGAETAEALAEAGARVWLMARSEEVLADLATKTGGKALPADLADDASVWDALDRLQDELEGPPSIVVNAAGTFGLGPFSAETVRSFDEHLSVNLRGSFLVVRSLLPGMLQRGDGLIVNVGSVAGRRAFPGNAAYSASKFGLRGLHEVLLEATDTELWDELDPDSDPALPDRADMLRPSDVAEAVLFLATRPPTVRIPVLQIERA